MKSEKSKVTKQRMIKENKYTGGFRPKFPQSWVFNILKRESTIPPNEEIIRCNICNVELQPNICDV